MPAYDECIKRFDSVAKPIGSLGKLETLIAKIAAIQNTAAVDISKKAALVFCADNGVTAQGVSSHQSEITAALVRLHREGKSSVAVMAKAVNADLFVYELGTTADITKGPAMTREQALSAIDAGRDAIRDKAAKGYKLFAIGETGIGNTTTAAAVASVLLGIPPKAAAGRGAGLDDAGLVRKKTAIERAIAVNEPNPQDPLDVLTKLGGLDIAAMTGAYLECANVRAAAVIDGFISSVAALCAVRINPIAADYLLPSHLSAEEAARLVLDALAFEPVIHADMRLGEGTGAVAMFALLDMALTVYNNAARFSEL